ncbi:hypothetical protein ACGF5C_31120 [Micromonospora sp. NPDC047620]|uniref:hypothetical protein n=1 Tax=Micromonospora sp. NPDC047620 TaxID=3364251 RepID=UPI00372179C3
MTTLHALATALADDGWHRTDLVEQGGLVLGVRRRWLWPVADAVLVAYPHPPTDRPRELATFLTTLDPLRAAVVAARQHNQPIIIRTRPVAPTRTVGRPWHTPVIDDVGALAAMLDLGIEHLDWHADRRAMNPPAAPLPLPVARPGTADRGAQVPAPPPATPASRRGPGIFEGAY